MSSEESKTRIIGKSVWLILVDLNKLLNEDEWAEFDF